MAQLSAVTEHNYHADTFSKLTPLLWLSSVYPSVGVKLCSVWRLLSCLSLLPPLSPFLPLLCVSVFLRWSVCLRLFALSFFYLFFLFFCFIPSFPGSHSPRSCLLCLLLTPVLSSFSSHLLQVVFVDSLFHRCCFVAGVCPVSQALTSHLYLFYLGVHATKFSSNETSCTSSCTCTHLALQGSVVANKSGGMLMGLRHPCLHLKALKHARILLVWKVRGIKGVRAGKEGWG